MVQQVCTPGRSAGYLGVSGATAGDQRGRGRALAAGKSTCLPFVNQHHLALDQVDAFRRNGRDFFLRAAVGNLLIRIGIAMRE
jgi:hypothetical protein